MFNIKFCKSTLFTKDVKLFGTFTFIFYLCSRNRNNGVQCLRREDEKVTVKAAWPGIMKNIIWESQSDWGKKRKTIHC